MVFIHLYWSHYSICLHQEKKEIVYDIFSDEFMDKFILNSMNMKNIFILYDHYPLQLNLEKNCYPNGRY